MRKCKICGKERKKIQHWFVADKLFHGCEYCRLHMLDKIKREREHKDDEDDIL